MAIPDFLQIPLKNIKTNPSLTFPFALDYISPPVSSIEQFFYTFDVNALYFIIPGLRNLKTTKIVPIHQENIKATTSIFIFCIIMMVVMVISNIIMGLLQIRFVNIKHYSHRFIETLSPKIIQEKLKSCEAFIKSYRFQGNHKEETQKTVTTPAIRAINETQQLFAFRDRTTKMIEDEVNFNLQTGGQLSRGMQSSSMTIACQKRKKNQIFSLNSKAKILLKRIITSSPVILVGILLIVVQSKEKQILYNLFFLQNGIEYTILDIRLVYLYGLQLGTYSFTLQAYQSMIQQAMAIVFQMFYVVKYLLSGLAQNQDETFKTLTYGNLCQLDQTDFFSRSDHSFPGRYNLTQCSLIDNGILTKGFNGALLSYVQSANNLFMANVMAGTYSPSQKLAYFNNTFFTDTIKAIDYLIVTMQTASSLAFEQYSSLISYFTNITTISAILLIAIIILILIFVRKINSSKFGDQINQTCSLFALISCRTITQNKELKEMFTSNLEDLKFIE